MRSKRTSSKRANKTLADKRCCMAECSVASSISVAGMPMVISSGNPRLRFLVDTGSNSNYLFDFTYNALKEMEPGNFVPTKNTGTVFGMGDNDKEMFGVKFKIHFFGKKHIDDYGVIPAVDMMNKFQECCGMQFHGILGTPFLTRHGWVVNFKDCTIKVMK